MTNKITMVLAMTTRLGALAALGLGAAFWLDYDIPLHIHMAVGCLVVLALWGLAVQAGLRAPKLAVAAGLLGIALPIIGVAQLFLPVYLQMEEALWVLQILHVLMALVTIGVAETLTRRLKTA